MKNKDTSYKFNISLASLIEAVNFCKVNGLPKDAKTVTMVVGPNTGLGTSLGVGCAYNGPFKDISDINAW